jgi:hypothetical protein
MDARLVKGEAFGGQLQKRIRTPVENHASF